MRRSPFFVCSLRVEGLNLERLLHLLQAEGIPLLEARRESQRRIRLLCYEADRAAILALLEQKGWTLKDEKLQGLSLVKERLRRRKALPIAAAACLAFVLIGLQFVWDVRIEGARMYAGDMAAFLLEENIQPGRAKRDIDVKALENQLYLRYPRIAWVTAYVQGVSLVVDCRLGEYADAPDAAPGDLVATRDGIVSAVLTRAGTAQVEVGEIVRAGQVLIAGQERVADEQTVPVRADGAVRARVWESAEAGVSLYAVQSSPTGREQAQWRVCTPWFCWPTEAETPEYLAFDRDVAVTPVVGSFFPVWLERTTDAEVALERRARSVNAAKAEAAQAALRLLSQKLGSNQIIDKWVDYCMIEGGRISAIVTAELDADIGVPADEWNGGIRIDPTAGIP